MKKAQLSTIPTPETWPHRVVYGAVKVTIHKRKTPSGHENFMVVYKDSDGKRKFPCFKEWLDASGHADSTARRLAGNVAMSRTITSDEAMEYFANVKRIEPFGITLDATTTTVVNCLGIVPDLQTIEAACRFYKQRHKKTQAKTVAEVVTDLLTVKKLDGISDRYTDDLNSRLTRFADDFKCNIGSVDTASIQEWLNNLKLSAQSRKHFRAALNLLFTHAVSIGCCIDNPVNGVQKLKVKTGDIEIFTPDEITRLLAAASPEFLPCLAIQAFAGLRSAEVERLEWSDIDFTERHIVLSTSKTKTASRRIVPLAENLIQWLADYKDQKGLVWKGGHDAFYDAQQDCAAATEIKADEEKGIKAQPPVKWKANALRHSFVSYRLAQTQNAAQTSLEAGNSAQVVFKHYREIVKPADAVKWFSVAPVAPANVTPISSVTAAQVRV
jgi:integrase